MLKQRLMTAIILIPLVIFLLFWTSPRVFCLWTALVVLGCAFEWSRLMDIKRLPLRLIYPFLMLFILASALSFSIPYALYIAGVWWIVAGILVFLYPRGSHIWGYGKMLRGLFGILVLVPCWMAINFIRSADNGIEMLLLLFVLIWGADSGAYFIGKKWGKTKLAKEVSPGKSWQGLYGAYITAVIIALVVLIVFKTPLVIWPAAIALSLVTVSFSVIGDLFESMLKRKVGVKDSGNLLPGHGGLLDRIDSLTAAAPIFALGAMWIGKIYH